MAIPTKHICFKPLLISRVLLVAMFVWLNAEGTHDSTSNLNAKFYLHAAGQTLFQLDNVKENSVSPSVKDFTFILTRHPLKARLVHIRKLFQQFLNVNSFGRNPFYVQATINAP